MQVIKLLVAELIEMLPHRQSIDNHIGYEKIVLKEED